ncbi:hypothetical protein L6452_37101 [Arctium lappa]|uniref:Uncharacterized protein n=1 Tax=Arctium lappa TaxID=4217 RepID=A0ACB8Y1F7_ARCLA|nr:hypothetical protein L6452_37101 [Arctium lappa]
MFIFVHSNSHRDRYERRVCLRWSYSYSLSFVLHHLVMNGCKCFFYMQCLIGNQHILNSFAWAFVNIENIKEEASVHLVNWQQHLHT